MVRPSLQPVHEPEITGGASGLYGIPHPTLFGYTIRTSFEKFLLASRSRRLLSACA